MLSFFIKYVNVLDVNKWCLICAYFYPDSDKTIVSHFHWRKPFHGQWIWIYFSQKWWFQFLNTSLIHKMLIDGEESHSGLNSHSDGTHSLQGELHWSASDIVLPTPPTYLGELFLGEIIKQIVLIVHHGNHYDVLQSVLNALDTHITILLLRVVSENDALERIEDYAFYNLTELKEMYVAALHLEITTNYIVVAVKNSIVVNNMTDKTTFFLPMHLSDSTITKSKNLVIQKHAFWRLPKLQYLWVPFYLHYSCLVNSESFWCNQMLVLLHFGVNSHKSFSLSLSYFKSPERPQ